MANSRYQQQKQPKQKTWKTKPNKAHEKRQNKYALQAAKNSMKENQIWTPQPQGLNFNFNTPSHNFVAIVVVFGLLNRYRVSAQILPTCPRHVDGDSQGIFANKLPAHLYSVKQISPCNEKLGISDQQVTLSCSTGVVEIAHQNPSLYETSFHSIQGAIKNLEQTQSIHCRFSYLFSSESNCKITLISDEEMETLGRSETLAIYAPSIHTVLLRISTNLIIENQEFILHETIHALDKANSKKNEYSTLTPYTNETEKKTYDKIIKKGVDNLKYFYTLLMTPHQDLTKSEKQLLEDLNKLASGYAPKIQFGESKKLDPFGVHYIKSEKSYGDFSLRRIASQTSVDGKIKTALISHSQSPLENALLDGMRAVDMVSMYPESKHALEMNAYIHETFEYYPELLEKIFPGLSQYMISRGSQEYQTCMNKPFQSDSRFGGRATFFSTQPKQKETEVVQKKSAHSPII
jgi:hypothetical protein